MPPFHLSVRGKTLVAIVNFELMNSMSTQLEGRILLQTFSYCNNISNKLSNNGMHCSYYIQTFWHQFRQWAFPELETCYLQSISTKMFLYAKYYISLQMQIYMKSKKELILVCLSSNYISLYLNFFILT